MASELPDYAVNLRRLFAWHLQSSKDAALVLGAAEHTVSGWLTGKRQPGGEYITKIGAIYDVNPVKLLRDPDAFGTDVADPKRYHLAEEQIAMVRRARLEAVE